jgi:hypothetical protein
MDAVAVVTVTASVIMMSVPWKAVTAAIVVVPVS